MMKFGLATVARETGQTMVEYALILALIALVSVAALTFIGGPNPGFFSRIGSLIGP